jgi:hypothetical protein
MGAPEGGAPFSGAGLAKAMVSQGVRVYEVSCIVLRRRCILMWYQVAFWDPTPTEKLARTSRAPSCPEFIDVVDNYTLLLHQGLIEHAFLDETESVSTTSNLCGPSLTMGTATSSSHVRQTYPCPRRRGLPPVSVPHLPRRRIHERDLPRLGDDQARRDG